MYSLVDPYVTFKKAYLTIFGVRISIKNKMKNPIEMGITVCNLSLAWEQHRELCICHYNQ